MKKTRQYFTAFLLAAVFITVAAYPQNVYAKWVVPKEASFEPTVFGRITTQTDKVRVYVYGGTEIGRASCRERV